MLLNNTINKLKKAQYMNVGVGAVYKFKLLL